MKDFQRTVLLLFSSILTKASGFTPAAQKLSIGASSPIRPFRQPKTRLLSVAVPIAELEQDLTPAEKSITSVVRKCGPAVAYVTSVSGPINNNHQNGTLPSGQALGSGSGFQVSEDGYVCTNYHVIERAYTIQQTLSNLETMLDLLAGNVTEFLPGSSAFVDSIQSAIKDQLNSDRNDLAATVYVRINSDTRYELCRIVDVKPDLDLAVLKLEDSTIPNDGGSVSFGFSSNLLVGQSVVAIGNPFGLDKTVTTGVVSAVNREFRAGTARTPANAPIRNCIQTDAAINPGNSGGPLLNLKGEVIGINTAIITTSGSNAGIGFAVPADQLKPLVEDIIRADRVAMGTKKNRGYLGISVLKQSGESTRKNAITSVDVGSPAEQAGLNPIKIQPNGSVELGDSIVAVSGNEVSSLQELQNELDSRISGEKISLTIEDASGEKRVVYVTLGERR